MATRCTAPTLLEFPMDSTSAMDYYQSQWSSSPLVYKMDAPYGAYRRDNVSWGGAAPGTSNTIIGYEIQGTTADSVAGLGTWGTDIASVIISSTQTYGNADFNFGSALIGEISYSGVTPGNFFKLRIRTLGSAGASYYSVWRESPVYRLNVSPSSPNYNAPDIYGTHITYNPRARQLITLGSDSDGSVHYPGTDGYLWINDSGVTVANQTTTDSGKKSPLRKLVVLRASPYTEETTAEIGVDGGDCPESGWGSAWFDPNRPNVHYIPASYTDALEAGTTRIKAVHMTELRDMIDDVREYYGLSAYSWAETIETGTSMAGWRDHVAEMRTAIGEIITLVNGWDTAAETNRITAPTWITIVGAQPSAAVMQQIRDIIPTL